MTHANRCLCVVQRMIKGYDGSAPSEHHGSIERSDKGTEQAVQDLCSPTRVGNRAVARHGGANWRQPTSEPLPGEYILYNDLLWQFAAPKLPAELAEWWKRSDAASGGPVDTAKVAEAAAFLVDDPAMEGWVRWSVAMWHNVWCGMVCEAAMTR